MTTSEEIQKAVREAVEKVTPEIQKKLQGVLPAGTKLVINVIVGGKP